MGRVEKLYPWANLKGIVFTELALRSVQSTVAMSVCRNFSFCHLLSSPIATGTASTGDFWSKGVLLKLQNIRTPFFNKSFGFDFEIQCLKYADFFHLTPFIFQSLFHLLIDGKLLPNHWCGNTTSKYPTLVTLPGYDSKEPARVLRVLGVPHTPGKIVSKYR